MGNRTSPTVRRRRLALELRRLRAEAGVRAADVAKELGCSPGKISQMETSRVSISVPDAKAMLELYGITGERRDVLVDLARSARLRGWWAPYAETLRPWFQRYVGLETEADAIHGYRPETVPGLLQTAGYQRALARREGWAHTGAELDLLVRFRAARQEILTGTDAPNATFVLGEAALCRRVGSAEVMAEQLHRLLEAGRRDNVTLQILPFSAGAHPARCGGFTILEFPDPADPAVVYLEHLTGACYLQAAEEVSRYRLVLDELRAGALSRTRSAALIRAVLREV